VGWRPGWQGKKGRTAAVAHHVTRGGFTVRIGQ
jgi:hypothetical protein